MAETNGEECSIVFTMKILGMKWMVPIIAEFLIDGPQSFTDLQNKLCGQDSEPITNRVLTDKLNLLTEEKILYKHPTLDKRRSVYSLTEKGEDFHPVFQTMKAWGIKWGGIRQKKCKSYSCIHTMLEHQDLAKLKTINSDF